MRRRRFLFFVTFVHLRNALRLSFQMLSSVAKRCKMVSSRVGISREKNCPANPRIQKFFNLLVALLHPIKAQSNQWQWKFNKVYLEQTVPAIPTAFFFALMWGWVCAVGCPSPEVSLYSHTEAYWEKISDWLTSVISFDSLRSMDTMLDGFCICDIYRRKYPSSRLTTGLDSLVVDSPGRYTWWIITTCTM